MTEQKDWDAIAAEVLNDRYYESYLLWRSAAQKQYEYAVQIARYLFDRKTKDALAAYDAECSAAYVAYRAATQSKFPEISLQDATRRAPDEWAAFLARDGQAKMAYEDATKDEREEQILAIADAAHRFEVGAAVQVAHMAKSQVAEA